MQTLSDRSSFLERNLKFSVLHLASWPPLPDLLHDTAPHVTRICALLARKPSVGMLIPVMLDMPPQVTYPLLDRLYAKGHIYPVSGVMDAGPAALSKADHEHQLPLPHATVSFLDKVWLRLMDAK